MTKKNGVTREKKEEKEKWGGKQKELHNFDLNLL